jgi:SAM-dependent methyltransferase
VLEHGAGSGTLSALLLRAKIAPLILSEPDLRLATRLNEKFAAVQDVRIFKGTLEDYLEEAGSKCVDGIVSSNVLEHIEDDEACLATMRKLIRPGGHLALYVPARPELYSDFDRVVGHHRRYQKHELRQKLARAGFKVELLQYRNLVATLPWLWLRLSKQHEVRSANVDFYDRYVFPILRRIEDTFPPPYGLNLLSIAS